MVNEQKKTLDALETSIQMEIEGKEYYLKASEQSNNETGRKLLQTLAGEEDVHRQKFEEIYNGIRSKKTWPPVEFRPNGGKNLRTILTRFPETVCDVKSATDELCALENAIKMEIKTHDYYSSQGRKAAYPAEKEFYEKLAAEEREHQLVLVDYVEYLKDPSAWFVSKEHHSLDGG